MMTKEKIRDAIYTRRYIYNFHYHLIWVTKYRNQTFTTEVLANEMKAILQQVADDNDKKYTETNKKPHKGAQ
ncbi:hypothetical protein LACFE_CDS1628 [Limosilactobacillus fermentum]|uniref:Transposase IS200-like domain-containing protein n=2 Tax=Limosilactobacillus fermentum TaxID=1613 RepID=A0A1D7ZZ27_LIMFE|nr:hypothetical protein LACFE_CDS1628 [Limosilactobacillus fermentum]